MTKHWVAALGLLATACSGGVDQAGNAAEPVALVALARVEQSALAPQVMVYGAAEPGPMGKRSLAAPAEGIVVSIQAPVGTHVARGQVVVRLSASPAVGLELAKASSDARAADAALARAQRLQADGLGSDAEIETARAAATSANATRTSLAGRAGAMTLRAPAAGVVDAIAPAVGDLVQPGTVVASVSRTDGLRVRFGVDPAVARTLRPGMPLAIAASAGRAPLSVPIQSVDPVADPLTRLYAVFATVPGTSGISIGETLTATVGSNQAVATPSIPYAALLDDAGQPYVYVVTGGVAHRRDVTPGAVNSDRVAITGGIKPGEMVVVEGGTALEDGMKVRTR
jgi:RND family efflux transporter MFP subunit